MVNSVSIQNSFQRIPRFDAQSRANKSIPTPATRDSASISSRNASTNLSWQAFRQTQKEQEANFNNPELSPLCFSEASQQTRLDSANRGAFFRFVPVFEDNNILIKIFDRTNTDMSPAEIEATGFHKKLFIVCKITGYGTSIFDSELADKLHEKFLRFANEKNCISEDFRDAKSNLIKLLLSEYLYQMLFATIDAIEKMPDAQPIVDDAENKVLKDLMDEFFKEKGLEICCQELLEKVNLMKDAIHKHSTHIQENIPVLAEEEMLSVQPSYDQRIKDNVFYAGFL